MVQDDATISQDVGWIENPTAHHEQEFVSFTAKKSKSERPIALQQSPGTTRRQRSCVTARKPYTIMDDPCISHSHQLEDEDTDNQQDEKCDAPLKPGNDAPVEEPRASVERAHSTPILSVQAIEGTDVEVASAPAAPIPASSLDDSRRKSLFHRVKNKIIPVIMTVGAARSASSAKAGGSGPGPPAAAASAAASADPPAPDAPAEPAAAAVPGAAARRRFQRAVNQVAMVQKLDGQAIFNQIRAVRERREAAQAAAGGAGGGAAGAVLVRLKLLLSSERSTRELAWLSYQPRLLEKEIERIREQQARPLPAPAFPHPARTAGPETPARRGLGTCRGTRLASPLASASAPGAPPRVCPTARAMPLRIPGRSPCSLRRTDSPPLHRLTGAYQQLPLGSERGRG